MIWRWHHVVAQRRRCCKDIMVLSASVPLLGSISRCVSSYFLSVSLVPLLSPLVFVCLPFLPVLRVCEFMCLADPEAVNLVIHNRYQPHLFSADKSDLSDNYISLCTSAKGCPFLCALFRSLGFFCWYWFSRSTCTWLLYTHNAREK